jgi:serine/threonine protein kinase
MVILSLQRPSRLLERSALGDAVASHGRENTAMPPTSPHEGVAGELRFGPFALERELGRGAMGVVFLARKDSTGERFALKVLDSRSQDDPEMVSRFRREAQFMLAMNHPNVVRAFEAGVADGSNYLAMEYVQGVDLKGLIAQHGRIDPRATLGYLRQVAEALAYGARIGVVHRDIKPSNILVLGDGTVKLADMGLAILAHRQDLRLTAPGVVVGSPAYMSPEQARGDREIDARSDIYSLGCTMYHAATGTLPFDGPSAIAVAQKHFTHVPVPPSSVVPELPKAVDTIVMKCMQRSPADRYQTAVELIDAIDDALRSRTSPAHLAPADAHATAVVPAGRVPGSSARNPVASPPAVIAVDPVARAPGSSGRSRVTSLPPVPRGVQVSRPHGNTKLLEKSAPVSAVGGAFSIERVLLAALALIAVGWVIWKLM